MIKCARNNHFVHSVFTLRSDYQYFHMTLTPFIEKMMLHKVTQRTLGRVEGLSVSQLARLKTTTKALYQAPPSGGTSDDVTSGGPPDPRLNVFQQNATKWWNGKEFSILRSMNELRVPFIIDGLDKPIDQAKLLDVGCGGGILSEPLARLGASVMGIDPVFESINQAQLHAQTDQDLKERLRYRSCNIEDLSAQQEHHEAYDGLILSEVLEHIEDVESFLLHCTKVLRPNGSLFITTINQTPLSWLSIIFLGEYVLKQLPKATHSYDMFVNVKGLKVMLERMGYHIKLVNGFMYEPVGGNFYWTSTTLTHYAMQAVKIKPLSQGLNYQQKRHAPKNKKAPSRPKRPLEDDEMMPVVPVDLYRKQASTIMEDFKAHLETHLSRRTSTATFESLKLTIEGFNEQLELRDIAQISMKGNNLIVINLSSMPEAIKPAMKALTDLGNIMNPQVEVNNIYVPVPRITREYRENLAAAAKQAATQTKDKLKTLFSDYSSRAKSNKSGVSVDLVRDTVENLQFDLNKRLQDVETMLKTKVDQLLNQ